ncbi:putative uncharacterized protein DDB_G0277255 isoform X1 [Octopus sinensis]|uniref:Transcription cofactor vestigial-like protein 4 n=1 Tax=Octopus sinensis TaxID=2607531 RepID=A0A6P7S5H2_9MOLL|nr:putative uncharacterized protein DDB_G0277255 isoform X1 [Octopus sinensis]
MSDTCDLVASSDAWSSWHRRGENFYKPCCGLDARESPNKELPTKVLKHDRIKDRQDLSQTLNFDRGHTVLLTNKRCAGTQTQFSSFEFSRDGEVVMIAEPYHQSHQSHHHQQQQSTSMVSQCLSQSLDMDTENLPLNLSVSNNNNNNNNSGGGSSSNSINNNNNNNNNSNTNSHHYHHHHHSNNNNNNSSPIPSPANSSALSTQQQQLRPSVITCAFANRYTNMNTFVQPHSPSRRELTSGMCDPEEHFRRSLGKDYKKLNRQSPVPMTRTKITDSVASVNSSDNEPVGTCSERLVLLTTQENSPSVDDHFARSLGNSTWTNLKSKTDVLIESVDDHFAKALGDTWHRIKAEQENHCNSSRSSSPLQLQSQPSSQQQTQTAAQQQQQTPLVST